MLLDILIRAPSLLMTTIAWYIHVGLVLICLIVMLAVAMGVTSFYKVRAKDDALPHRPSPAPIRL